MIEKLTTHNAFLIEVSSDAEPTEGVWLDKEQMLEEFTEKELPVLIGTRKLERRGIFFELKASLYEKEIPVC